MTKKGFTENLIDSKFHRLSPIEITYKNNILVWKCLCECGNTTYVAPYKLKNNKVKSCGCLNLETKFNKNTGGKYLTGCEFKNIRTGARRRNILFSITIQDIEDVYEKQNFLCNLSGISINFNSRQLNKRITYGNASVDRIKNELGYTKDNIQIIDKRLNIAKNTMSQKEYIDLCIKVANHQMKKYD